MTSTNGEPSRQPSSYQGVALVAPTSFGYTRQSPHGAAWFIGSTLREMLKQAGLEKQAVDGLAVSSFSLGADTAISLTQHLGMGVRWIEHMPYGGAAGLLAMRRAARAIQCGDANIIACIGGDGAFHRSFELSSGVFSQFTIDASFPYAAGGPNAAFALITRHYMDRFGATREDFARIAVSQRYNANHYPPALLGHKTLTTTQYLQSRSIVEPVHLFDCVMPCAGGEGFLMMSEERARQLNLPYCTILSADEYHNAHPEDDIQFRGGWTHYVDALYQRADTGPEDIDILQTYDDYPAISMLQMEDLGFCAKGEAAAFVNATDLRFDGSGPESKKLAHNTSGGQLSVGQAGCAGGYLGLTESLRQLTGRANGNQVPRARTAMVSGFGMINYDRGLCSAATILQRGDS